MDVIVITGTSGMGLPIARRIGSGHQLLLADIDATRLDSAAEALRNDGLTVATQLLDVADAESVSALAQQAATLGFIRAIVHTAGVSPLMADAARVYAVDLVGTANIIDAFEGQVGAGSVGVIIASMAATASPRDPELEHQLALAPTAELLNIACNYFSDDSEMAYAVAKRGNQLRVEQGSLAWGERGARLVSVSPGIISTDMARLELEKPHVAEMLRQTPMGRVGTPEDIASAVQWLISPAANYITGSDLAVDGGAIAMQRAVGWGGPGNEQQ
jgi:NAD(P)-dependent dehydrogenase (short-subunit alcohol dehydrogenase family)